MKELEKSFMDKREKRKRGKLAWLLATGGSALSIVALVVSLLSGWFIIKLARYMDTVQKTLPVVRKAAQLYLEQNAPADPAKTAKKRVAANGAVNS